MKNKYYTPELSEIFVGFECEIKNSSDPNNFEWEHFEIIGVDDAKISGSLMDWSFYDSRNAIEEESVRVKYLDKQNIEECGFELITETTQEYHFKHKNGIGLSTRKFPGGLITIILNENSIIKNIIIKNKSELIKILKQLGI